MESQRVIISDIDETLVPTLNGINDFYNSISGGNFKFEDYFTYSLWEIWGVSKEEVQKILTLFYESDFFKKIKPFSDAQEAIKNLSYKNYLIAATCRRASLHDKTKKFINFHFPEFNEVISNGKAEGGAHSKLQICLEKKADYLIDDNSRVVLECANAGITCFLIDRPWNKDCRGENIIRVKNLKEVEKYLKNKKNIIEEIRKFVESECKRNPAGQGYDPYIYHFIPMRNHAVNLGAQKNADLEIIEIAALLHDIGSIIYGRENHHITGGEIAEKKLKELNYPKGKIDKVKKCILNHRGSVSNFRESVEEQIIAEADAISAFEDIAGIFQAAYCWEGHTSRNSVEKAVREKLIRKFNQLSFEGRELIKLKYEAAMVLLGG